MIGKVVVVDERVELAMNVAKYISDKFDIANLEGRKISDFSLDMVHKGIGLLKRDNRDSVLMETMETGDEPREFFGELWFQNQKLKASPKKKWVLRLFNAETNRDEAYSLAQRLAIEYSVDISIRLVQDEPLLESIGA
ncbi:MAG TPA: hypothetical protein P5080_02435 [Candidatus Paceibacterota bacterium]|nr:hypothetical protein [Candidatus Pacearchaeota archaeon]HRZ50827.1 hypothetical protein [Candidatus Paceibacterota bacterium]HSA36548.1 hypothetical protein [Candidatus Paceibacterota bacterium]